MLSFSDRLSRRRPLGRREFLQIGGLGGLGGLLGGSLANRASAASTASPVTGKSVIFLFQQGGPTQFETFDPKLDAPSGIATVGGQVSTSQPGVFFGESLGKLSKHAHRMAVVRNYQTNTGHGGVLPVVSPLTQNANIGSVYSRVAGANHPLTGLPSSMFIKPQSIDPEQKTLGERFGKFDTAGPLGKAYTPFQPGGDGPLQKAMKLQLERARFDDRRYLLKQFGQAQRALDTLAETDGVYGLQGQAMDLILKGVAEAFDLSQEDPRTLARYDTGAYYNPALWKVGGKNLNNVPWYTAHTQTLGKMLLLARRLCEAGCGFITIHSEFVWDFHADQNNVPVSNGKELVIKPFDHAVSAFIEDCEQRGLADDILLVCCGEMGRTPKINKNGGRDHWPKLAPLMLYGGGITDGQVIGESDRNGGESLGAPQNPDDLLATIFHTLFNYGEARFIPDLPFDLRKMLEKVQKMPGVLAS